MKRLLTIALILLITGCATTRHSDAKAHQKLQKEKEKAGTKWLRK